MPHLLDEILVQARERLGADPTEILVTPFAVAALTVKNITLSASYKGIPIRCLPAERFERGDGGRVAIVVMDDGVSSALRVVAV